MEDITRVAMEFGIALVEGQHKFLLDGSIDNSEHVPAFKRIADIAYLYLKEEGVNTEMARKVRKELIARGRALFIEEWMRTMEEGEEPPDQQDQA